MTIETQVKSGNAVLAIRVDGDENLPSLILSNSLATDLTLWDDQIEVLTKLRRVIRYDSRGHGKSSVPPGPYSFADLVGDMIAVLDSLKIDEADILGLSIGGMTALGAAISHPARVRSVMCCCARAEFPPPAIALWDERIAIAKSKGTAGLADETLGRWFTEKTHKDRPEMVNRARRMILSTSADGYCASAEALKKLDYFRHLPQISQSALYLSAAADVAAPPDVMKAMADATPNARFTVIPDAAHIANVENAAAFNAAICEFLLRSADK